MKTRHLLPLVPLALAACAELETSPDIQPGVAPDGGADAALADTGATDAADAVAPDAGPDAAAPPDAGPPMDTAPPGDAAPPVDTAPPVDIEDGPDTADVTPDVGPPPVLECDPTLASPAGPTSQTLNGFAISVDSGTGAWSVTPPGADAPALRGPGVCEGGVSSLRLATGQAHVFPGFGAFQITIEGGESDKTWYPASGASPSFSKSNADLRVTFPTLHPSASLVLRFAAEGETDLSISLQTEGDATGGELLMIAADGESYFGLGSQVTGMDLRGGTYPLWTQEQGIGKPPDGGLFPISNIPEAAYAPMGILHSSAGWSAVLATDTYAELDLAESATDRVALRTHAGLPSLVLVPGETPKERVTAVTRYTGKPPRVAPWQLAPWNDAVGGPDRLYEVAGLLRDNDIPSSAIWSEDWIGGEQTANGYRLSYAWAWDPETYPDLPNDVKWLHARGFAFLAYFNPFVPEPTAMWDEGVAGGWLIKNADGEVYEFLDPAFRTASLVDLSNPEARGWLKSYLKTAADDLGIDGWMADFAEWMPHDAVLWSGESAWQAHNRYPIEWQLANREVMEEVHGGGPEKGWTFFVRSGWASTSGGTAGIVPSMWGGDQDTDWALDDGLPTVIPIAAHLGLCGVGVFGSDIAGYTSIGAPNTTKELFLRWASLGAFHPLMRTHHGSDECGNWSFERDAETLAHYRRMATLHILLYPFFAALVEESADSGLPVTRHPWLVEPSRPGLWIGSGYLYLLGDDVLVAPVYDEGELDRFVRLPGTGWWPLLGDAPVVGTEGPGDTVVVLAPAGPTEIPVFVRPGAAIPLLGDRIDTLHGATDLDVTTLDDVAGRYRAALYPDGDGAVAPTTVGAATVSATGLSATPDWSAATIGGLPVLSCDLAVAGVSCVDGDTLVVRGLNVAVAVGGAVVTVDSPTLQETRLGIAGAAFGEWATPTDVTDLYPDIPPPCE